MSGLSLNFTRSAAQKLDLQGLLRRQADPTSADFHRWLTPDAFGRRFGLADADLQATATWLRDQGFQIDELPPSRDRIRFSGTVAQVAQALGAKLRSYTLGQDRFFAPATDLSLPADLAPLVAGVGHLSSLRPKSTSERTSQNAPAPLYSDPSSGSHFLTPPDLNVLYNATSLAPGSNGAGQAIALVGQSYVDSSANADLTASLYFNTETPSGYFIVPGSGNQAVSPGDLAESNIDLQYAPTFAPKAKLYLVYVGDTENYDVFDSLAYAIQTDLAPVISVSYGICEPLLDDATLTAEEQLLEQAAAQGQTVIAASGDAGSTGCARYPPLPSLSTAQQSRAVFFPADSPMVTAVGGLEMVAGSFTAGANQYWSSPGSQIPAESLLTYVPEVVWNEDVVGREPFAGGGGASAFFPRPSWQIALPALPAGSTRLLPDVALQASADDPGFVFCTDDFFFYRADGGTDNSCSEGLQDRNGLYTRAGGTSFAAPVMAGFVALLNQLGNATGQGSLNPTLYGLATTVPASAGLFHDVITGSIACLPGVLNCGPDGQLGYAAGPGYDEATGFGSFDVTALAAAWPGVPAAPTQQTTQITSTLTGSSDPGAASTFAVTVLVPDDVANPTAPTGMLTLTLDGTVLTSTAPLGNAVATGGSASASVTYPVTAPASAGTHILTAFYPGDVTHAPSRGTTPLSVGNVVPSGSITITATSLTLAPNAVGTVQVSVTPGAGYHGRVFWSLSLVQGSSLSGCYGIEPLLVASTGTSPDTLSLGIGQACSSGAAATGADRHPWNGSTSRSAKGSTAPPFSPGALPLSACLLLGALGLRKKRHTLPSCVALALVAGLGCAGLMGCGGSGAATPAPAPAPTPAPTPTPTSTTYTFQLRGVDSVNAAVNGTASFVLTVTN